MKKLLPWILILWLLSACAPSQSEALPSRDVYYAGEEGQVKTALSLAGYTLVTDPGQAEVLVLNGAIPEAPGIAAQVEAGKRLVLILGEGTSQAEVQGLLIQTVTLTEAEGAVSLVDATGGSDRLVTEIVWNGAPQVRERSTVDGLDSQAYPIVSAYETSCAICPGAGECLIRFQSRDSGNAAQPQSIV